MLEDLENAVEALEGEGLDVLELAVRLLRLCHIETRRLAWLMRDAEGHAVLQALRRAWAGFFREVDDAWLDAAEFEELRRRLLARWPGVPGLERLGRAEALLLSVRAAAEALDEVHGARFLALDRSDGPRVLGPLEGLVVPQRRLDRVLEGPFTPRPAMLGVRPTELTNVVLLPEETPFDVCVDDSNRNLVTAALERGRVGFAWPMADVAREVTWDEGYQDGAPVFQMVRPTDEPGRSEIVRSLLDRLDRAGADVVILPELSVTAGIVEELRAWLPASLSVRVVVAGSFHEAVEGGCRNVCRVLVKGGTDLVHTKIAPFELPLAGVLRRERLRHADRPRITVQRGVYSSWTAVICKDLMDPSVRDVLQQVRPLAVFVPAWSPRTDPFLGYGTAAATESQGILLLANETDEPSACAGLVCVPAREDVIHELARAALGPPEVRMFELRHRT